MVTIKSNWRGLEGIRVIWLILYRTFVIKVVGAVFNLNGDLVAVCTTYDGLESGLNSLNRGLIHVLALFHQVLLPHPILLEHLAR